MKQLPAWFTIAIWKGDCFFQWLGQGPCWAPTLFLTLFDRCLPTPTSSLLFLYFLSFWILGFTRQSSGVLLLALYLVVASNSAWGTVWLWIPGSQACALAL